MEEVFSSGLRNPFTDQGSRLSTIDTSIGKSGKTGSALQRPEHTGETEGIVSVLTSSTLM